MVKDGLANMHAALVGLEEHARKLQNPNFADIVRSASGKVFQLMGHPDLEKVAELHDDKHGTANVDAFQAELAALEKSGNGETERAKELRAMIGQQRADKPSPVTENASAAATTAARPVQREPFPAI
jgi:hypothetical protein